MKKLLMVTNAPICPVINGSRKRMYNLVKLLEKAGFEVQIVISNDRVGYMSTREQMSNKVHFFDSDRKKPYLAVKRGELREKLPIKALRVYPIPYMIDDMFPNGLDDFVAKLHKREHFDYVMVEYVFMSKALTKLGKEVTKIIDTHDILANRAYMYYDIGVKPKTFYTSRCQERKGLLRADIIFAIQKDEKKYFAKQVRKRRRILTIGNYFEPVEQIEVKQNKKVLFVGSNNDPNREALQYFLNDIWKEVKERVPEAEFLIAGDVSNSVEASELYTKVGYVDDLTDVYDKARIVVNPMLSGTGLPIKSIEAMAYGKAMVMTESGARGLYRDGKEPKAFLLAHNTNEFIDELVLLLTDDEKVAEVQKWCRKFVTRYNERIYQAIIKGIKKS